MGDNCAALCPYFMMNGGLVKLEPGTVIRGAQRKEAWRIVRGIGRLDDAFTEFWDDERRKAMEAICREEGIQQEAFKAMIEDYNFSGKPPLNDMIVNALEAKPKILERKSVAERIVKKLLGLISTFDDGMGGT